MFATLSILQQVTWVRWPASGQYRVVGGRKEVTLVKGNTVSPVDGKVATLVQVDPTKNQSCQPGELLDLLGVCLGQAVDLFLRRA
ncbi:hypothetical protein [Dactylosporangium sp. CA-233914]|uniref:hypothetical protein n=1 Tax=Dactylosporangium sp. CA-233914 TaxID=3239934 RepID=UPI003D92C130